MAEDRTPRTVSPGGDPVDETEEPIPHPRKKRARAEKGARRPRVNEETLLQPSDDSERAAERGPGNRFS